MKIKNKLAALLMLSMFFNSGLQAMEKVDDEYEKTPQNNDKSEENNEEKNCKTTAKLGIGYTRVNGGRIHGRKNNRATS